MAKMKVAVIGCGTIANSAHIPAYMKNPDVEIKYVGGPLYVPPSSDPNYEAPTEG